MAEAPNESLDVSYEEWQRGSMTGTGIFFIVPTPIGNLDDFALRAQQTLRDATIILAEDTRHAQKLLSHYGITTPLRAFHEHNEAQMIPKVLAKLEEGAQIALISDAGTPAISDPGFRMVRALRATRIPVRSIPGPNAAVTALAASGLPSDRFTFEGFLPARAQARRTSLEHLQNEPRTMIFYEAPHRIMECLAHMAEIFGPDREASLSRELSKRFEETLHGTLPTLLAKLEENADHRRGEMVLVVAGQEAQETDAQEVEQLLVPLLDYLSVKDAAELTAKISGAKRRAVYDLALRITGKKTS